MNYLNNNLYNFQKEVLQQVEKKNKVAFYLDMGLGKTFVGAEKLAELNNLFNLVICQKSKLDDWKKHFEIYYPDFLIFDLTNKKQYESFFNFYSGKKIGFINYELMINRKELNKLKDLTVLIDESSLIQNENSKRTKFIKNLNIKNLILLSGTPVGGKYENLLSQMQLLGWRISKDLFFTHYVNYKWVESEGFFRKEILGYKNIDRLKLKMNEYGCIFMKTEDVFELPEQNFFEVFVNANSVYKEFQKKYVAGVTNPITNETDFLVGDCVLKQMLNERLLCGFYNKNKLQALKDLLNSSNDRFIIFYNFNSELELIKKLCSELKKEISVVNGESKDLTNYETVSDSVTLIQYKAGAMGLNLQKANKIIYFTPTLESELFEQSKKRIHRIGQTKPCFYYQLITDKSIERKIYATLSERKNYTDELFVKEKN